jgi:hypothetical protein
VGADEGDTSGAVGVVLYALDGAGDGWLIEGAFTAGAVQGALEVDDAVLALGAAATVPARDLGGGKLEGKENGCGGDGWLRVFIYRTYSDVS